MPLLTQMLRPRGATWAGSGDTDVTRVSSGGHAPHELAGSKKHSPTKAGSKHAGAQGKEEVWDGKSPLVGASRQTFNAILEQREEFKSALAKMISRPKASDRPTLNELAKLMEKAGGERNLEERFLIIEVLKGTNVFDLLHISSDMEETLAEIAEVRNYFIPGAAVAREGQEGTDFYCVLEGCCMIQRRSALEEEEGGGEEAVEAHQKYVLLANVVEALGIAAADQTGTSDAFVIVKCGSVERSTEVRRETLNPIWDQTLQMELPPDAETVQVQVWDKDAWGDNDFLGLAEVPVSGLKMTMHRYNAFTCKLESDSRYEDETDEGGVNVTIQGTIHFHLQITTEVAMERSTQITHMHKAADMLVPGDCFGESQMMHGDRHTYTVVVEQPSVLLRVSKEDYDTHIRPLQEKERSRKIDFFSPISPFSTWTPEHVRALVEWFKVVRYKPGEYISKEGEMGENIVWVLSGEAKAIKKVWDSKQHMMKTFERRHEMALTADPEDSELFQLYLKDLANTTDIDSDVPDAFMGWLMPGHTVNLEETLDKTAHTYSCTAVTPVECLVSCRGCHIGQYKELLEPLENSKASGQKRPPIISISECQHLRGRCPAYPHADDLKQQYAECKDWKKYKQHLVSNIIYRKRQKEYAMRTDRASMDNSNLLGNYLEEPRLPPMVKTENVDRGGILKLVREGSVYDPDEGMTIPLKTRLHRAMSPEAKVYTYSSERPPSSYGSYATRPSFPPPPS